MSSTSTFDTWVSWRSPNLQASLRLFCFPYAGGAALTFRTWPDSLPITIQICPVELLGRGKRIASVPFTRLQLLVQAIAIAILPYLDKPFAFFGHSMGGLVSFELARLLRKKYGKSPVHLFISG
jgi:medium-chain acyl-[acyl-carrier-protein] hydrolase